MRTRFIIALAIITLSLSACAQTVWTRPDTTKAQFQHDFAQCKFKSNAATSSSDNNFSSLYAYQVLLPQCMKARGYAVK